MRRLGVLVGSANDSVGQAITGALVQGLGALNWREGSKLRIDWRWAGGDPTLSARYAAELVALGPDVLLANGPIEIKALRRQTTPVLGNDREYADVFVHATAIARGASGGDLSQFCAALGRSG